jgi:hypothetical protein
MRAPSSQKDFIGNAPEDEIGLPVDCHDRRWRAAHRYVFPARHPGVVQAFRIFPWRLFPKTERA